MALHLETYTVDHAGLLLLGAVVLLVLFRLITRRKTTKLNGPHSRSWLFGMLREISIDNTGGLYEKWAEQYGSAFHVPGALGSKRVVLFDSKAISHFFAKDTYDYLHQEDRKRLAEQISGRSLFWAEGDLHKRQRRVLAPFFSNLAMRGHMQTFYGAAYKLKAAWDNALGSSLKPELVIDVQDWFDRATLDIIGIAGFEHEFGSLDGNHSDVARFFDFLSMDKPTRSEFLLSLLATVIPALTEWPSKRKRLLQKLNGTMGQVAKSLIERSHKEMEFGQKPSSGSILGALIKAEMATSNKLTEKEVLDQIKLLILAGYETSSIALTWVIIELSRNPEKQERLRKELSLLSGQDPTYDDLQTGLPYLDSVIQETLRIHSPVLETFRIAAVDDVIPLKTLAVTASGKETESIHVARGTPVVVPVQAINCSKDIWGPDAREFVPERWLNHKAGLPSKAKDFQGIGTFCRSWTDRGCVSESCLLSLR